MRLLTRVLCFYLSPLLTFSMNGIESLQDSAFSHEMTSSGETTSCPTWYIPTNDSQLPCQCGDTHDGLVRCTENEGRSSVLSCNCVTFDSSNNSVAVVDCLYTCHLFDGNEYIRLPRDPSQLEEEFCSQFHRKGPFCSKCVDGYAVSAFSIYLTCVECPRSRWLDYFALTILPLTLFYFVVLFFRFHAATAWLESYIFFCQIITSPSTYRLLLYRASHVSGRVVTPEEILSTPPSYLSRIFQTIYAIWNLNFLQPIIPPFCLDPNWTAMQVIALDYLTAFYPLFLVVINYVILVLHARNFKPLVIIWKPFSIIATRFRKKVAIDRHSVVNSFTTFLLLAYVKLVYVSSDLLHATRIRYPTGSSEKFVWFYDPTVPYFGKEHVGYGIFALLILVIAVILPFLFLALYSCKFFQKLFPWLYSKPQIHAIFDSFQGQYKDRTCGTRDYRYFPALFLGIRLLGVVFTEYIFPGYSVPLGSMIVMVFGMFVLVLQPYKKTIHNRVNGILLILMALWITSQSLYHFPINNIGFFHWFAVLVDFTLCALPLCYFFGLVAWYVRVKVKKDMCTERMKVKLRKLRLAWRTRLRKETLPPEMGLAENRAYSFPDRVVNPMNYSMTSSTPTVSTSQ